MKIVPLFPTAIAQYDLDPVLTEEELTFITNQQTCRNMYNTTSVDNYLLTNKSLSRLNKFITDSIDEYIDNLICPATNVNLQVTQSWANYTVKDQAHHQHKHPNSYLSCVFFVQTDPEKDKIYFVKDTQDQILIESNKFNEFNSKSWWLEAIPNTLYIFPSTLSHFVERVETETIRISISCNTFPVGILGNKNNLTELVVKAIND